MTCPFLPSRAATYSSFSTSVCCTVGVLSVALIVAPIYIPKQDAHSAPSGSVCDTYTLPLPFYSSVVLCLYRNQSEPKSYLVFGSRPMPSVLVTRKGCGGLRSLLLLWRTAPRSSCCSAGARGNLRYQAGAHRCASGLHGRSSGHPRPFPLGHRILCGDRLLLSEFWRCCIAEAGTLFSIATLAGAIVPWLVGFVSTHRGSLRNALLVPLLGC